MVDAPEDIQESGDIAAAINALLVEHGYPPDRVNSWWNDSAYEALDGLTPTAAWLRGEYQRVWDMLKAAYAASEDAQKRLALDSARAALIDKRIAELQVRYAS